MLVARTQILLQLTDDLLARLDERAARERRNRSEVIRDAEIDRAIDTVPAALLTERLTTLSGIRMHEVCVALAVATGCR